MPCEGGGALWGCCVRVGVLCEGTVCGWGYCVRVGVPCGGGGAV